MDTDLTDAMQYVNDSLWDAEQTLKHTIDLLMPLPFMVGEIASHLLTAIEEVKHASGLLETEQAYLREE